MYRDTGRRGSSSYDPHRREEHERYRQQDAWSSRPPQTPNDQIRSFRFPVPAVSFWDFSFIIIILS
jgi:hypothetical protein